MSFLFSFAAKSLQNFVLEGDQLKTMTGATELVDRLCRKDFLTELLLKTNVIGEVLQGAAGSARIRIGSEADATRLARVWPIFCHRWAPGLEVVQSIQEITPPGGLTAAIKAAETEMRLARNFLSLALPLATPIMERCRSTAKAATAQDSDGIPCGSSIARKTKMRGEISKDLSDLQETFGFTQTSQLPESFEDIAGSERAYLAIIHADGNGLGQMFMNLAAAAEGEMEQDKAQKCFAHISGTVIEEGTRAAVKTAAKSLTFGNDGKMRPIQPIVLAGDDLTLVCRADLAWIFTKAFLAAFEKEMQERLSEAKAMPDFPEAMRKALPEKLSAGAGVAYVSSHYPFSHGYALAETLASRAKNHAKSVAKDTGRKIPPSSLMFHRVSGAYAPSDYEDLKRTHLRGDGRLLGAGPYFTSGDDKPSLKSLETLTDALSNFPGGSVREILNLLSTTAGEVPPALERMCAVAGAAPSKTLKGAMDVMGLDDHFSADFHGCTATPLPDAWTLKLMNPENTWQQTTH